MCVRRARGLACEYVFVYVERVRGYLGLGYPVSLPGLYRVCQESSRAHVGVRGCVCGKSSWVFNVWLSGGIARSVSCVSVELVGWCGSTWLCMWKEFVGWCGFTCLTLWREVVGV